MAGGVPPGRVVEFRSDTTAPRRESIYLFSADRTGLVRFFVAQLPSVLYIIRADFFLAVVAADPMTAFNSHYYARLVMAFNRLNMLYETVRPAPSYV